MDKFANTGNEYCCDAVGGQFAAHLRVTWNGEDPGTQGTDIAC
jgi:hypothetical protein